MKNKICGRTFEYVMTKTMADEVLKNRVGEEKKTNPKDYLIKYVNQEFGIMGTCINVVLE